MEFQYPLKRLGYNRNQVEEWIPEILAEQPSALTVHVRTRKEMSKILARWDQIARVVELRNELSPETKIIGNGDISSLTDARQKASLSGADGVMLGRAIFGNPWLFHPEKSLLNISLDERLKVMIEHTYLFSKLLPHKSFSLMKKHYKAYVQGFPGAVELRTKLMEQETPEAVEAVVHVFLANQQKIL